MAHSNPKGPYKVYLDLRDRICNDFPYVFDRNNPVPLKIGIHHDLARWYDGEFSMKQIRRFLSIWTKRREYHLAMTQRDLRYDLMLSPSTLTLKHKARSASLVARFGWNKTLAA